MILYIHSIIIIPKERIMKEHRKHLKISSAIILILAVISFVRLAIDFLFIDEKPAILPDGSGEGVILITRIILVAISLIFLLPEIYVGVKGLRIASKPQPAKAHIIWAVVLIFFAVWGLIDPIAAIIQHGTILENAYAICSGIVSVAAYAVYIKSARAIANGR